ncbi:MAG TPA: tetratricopeptide repeat protein [Solirubrobacteraceae bacterium]|nr:tetratricopeptide repeat protein [Solirubrobacteraceae bacterium]
MTRPAPAPASHAMTFASTPRRRLAAAVIAAFGLGLALLSSLQRDVLPAAPTGAALAAPERARTSTQAEIARLQAAARRAPSASGPRVELATAYLQRVRETGDPSLYGRADALLSGVLAREPRNTGALVERAGLALSRHDFRLALELARRAQRLEPASVAALPPLVDALVELGRHDEAERTLQRLLDLKPNLSAYARVSYLRELRGDLRGAASALALAAAAGGPAAENVAAIEVLRGDLALVRGRRASARRAYAMALALVPGYAPAQAGRARLAAYSGDLRGAIARWRALVTRLPLPEYAIALGEAELAAGQARAGRDDLALVGAEQDLLGRAGVNSDAELAVFEADHGDGARALRLARRAWAAAPGLRSADALGWALTRTGRPREGMTWAARARRLGSADPLFAYHAAVAARATGDRRESRRLLRFALAHGLATRPWQARTARRLLGGGR